MADIPDIPDMPTDWWPESIQVVAKQGTIEWGFAINNDPSSTNHRDCVPQNLDALRYGIWMALHLPEKVI